VLKYIWATINKHKHEIENNGKDRKYKEIQQTIGNAFLDSFPFISPLSLCFIHLFIMVLWLSPSYLRLINFLSPVPLVFALSSLCVQGGDMKHIWMCRVLKHIEQSNKHKHEMKNNGKGRKCKQLATNIKHII